MGLKSFRALKERGVAQAQPEHLAQMQVYMHLAEVERAAYLAVCKDSDELYLERVKNDRPMAERLIERAGRIISPRTRRRASRTTLPSMSVACAPTMPPATSGVRCRAIAGRVCTARPCPRAAGIAPFMTSP